MKKNVRVLGLDVHAKTIPAAIAELVVGSAAKVRSLRSRADSRQCCALIGRLPHSSSL